MAYDDRFWNSESGDRVYDADAWDLWSQSLATDGYVHDTDHLNGGLYVRQADPADMSVNVDTGHMWIDGKHFRIHTNAENLAVAASDTDDRIDRAIVRVDRTVRTVSPAIKTGTAGTNPSPPALQQDSSIWEISLAQIFVGAGVTSISDTNITDERKRSVSLPMGIPAGGIIMWSGSTTDVPAGWALCDGANGTPDLRNRFVVGAGQQYAANDTGGEDTHVLTDAEMPSHAHSQDSTGDYSHSHNSSMYDDVARGGSTNVLTGDSTGNTYANAVVSDTHSHANPNTSTAGGDAAHENRPPYYALAFIMKL